MLRVRKKIYITPSLQSNGSVAEVGFVSLRLIASQLLRLFHEMKRSRFLDVVCILFVFFFVVVVVVIVHFRSQSSISTVHNVRVVFIFLFSTVGVIISSRLAWRMSKLMATWRMNDCSTNCEIIFKSIWIQLRLTSRGAVQNDGERPAQKIKKIKLPRLGWSLTSDRLTGIDWIVSCVRWLPRAIIFRDIYTNIFFFPVSFSFCFHLLQTETFGQILFWFSWIVWSLVFLRWWCDARNAFFPPFICCRTETRADARQ